MEAQSSTRRRERDHRTSHEVRDWYRVVKNCIRAGAGGQAIIVPLALIKIGGLNETSKFCVDHCAGGGVQRVRSSEQSRSNFWYLVGIHGAWCIAPVCGQSRA